MINNELLLLIEKHTDTPIEQTKKAQETLEFKLNKQMETFSLTPAIDSSEEGKWLLSVTSSEATNTVFNIIDENNSFLITTPEYGLAKDVKNLLTN